MKNTHVRNGIGFTALFLMVVFLVGFSSSAEARKHGRFRLRDMFSNRKLTIYGNGSVSLRNIMVNDSTRSYYLYLPQNSQIGKKPLVIACHGGGGTAQSMDKLSGGITKLADKEQFVCIFPQGIRKHWNDGRTVNLSNFNDVDFIEKVIDELVSEGLVDSKRVYSTGISNGGFFSQYLAKKIPDKVAAIASVAATLPKKYLQYEKTTPVPVLYILGTEDPLVPYEGGSAGFKRSRKKRGEVVSAKEAVAYWLNNNDVSESSIKLETIDADKGDGMEIVRAQYSNGDTKSDVSVYKIIGGGHTWPSGWQYLPARLVGKTSYELDANKVIWDFFSKHSK